MNRELISIVLPTYNRSRILPPALESCLNQSWENLELLVVDDGSLDATPEVVRGFAERDPRVKYLESPHQGLPRALNTGFRSARGELLTWTSDDNFYRPQALESMAECLRYQPGPALVYADMCFHDEMSGEVRDICNAGRDLRVENKVGACFLYPREIREKVGDYDPAFPLVEDYDYWLRVERQFPLVHLHRVLYDYHYHAKTLTVTREREVTARYFLLRRKFGYLTPEEFKTGWRDNLKRAWREAPGSFWDKFRAVKKLKDKLGKI